VPGEDEIGTPRDAIGDGDSLLDIMELYGGAETAVLYHVEVIGRKLSCRRPYQ
jgi:hypothetical protein